MGLFKPDLYRAFLFGIVSGSAGYIMLIGADARMAMLSGILP